MRILQIGNNDTSSMRLTVAVRQLDCAVDVTNTVEGVLDALNVANYDLLIGDFEAGIPPADLINLVRSVRSAKPEIPILACGSRDVLDAVITALGTGADDFVLRPLDGDELRIRVSALLARRPDREAVILECGPLRLDMVSRQVVLDGVSIDLTPRERSVLQVLLRHRGHVVSKDHIASRVFSMDEEAAPQAIETYVHRLRKKTEHPGVIIKTLRGIGYVLDEVT